MSRRFVLTAGSILLVLGAAGRAAGAGADTGAPADQSCNERYFGIHAVDRDTGRGVPLIELETVHHLSYITDSSGYVAIGRNELFGREVFFFVRGHGYRYPADGFGFRGFRVLVEPGKVHTVAVERINKAERLYRITGAGIYHDSILLGKKDPLRSPLLTAGVVGEDSVCAVPYRGKIYWLWGDTNRLSYPLGNFSTTAAVSLLPGKGGLEPDRGLQLEYFGDGKGFVKKMCPLPRPGPVWLEGLCTVRDGEGKIRLVAQYARMKDLGTCLERGICLFNDTLELFQPVATLDRKEKRCLRGHPLRVLYRGREYLLFGQPPPNPFPNMRVPATLDAVCDPASYEVFTCLHQESSQAGKRPYVDRGPTGVPVYRWRRAGLPFGTKRHAELIRQGLLKEGEGYLPIRDFRAGRRIVLHSGSVSWNPYRKRWILIAGEIGGDASFLGEIWYAEADTPVGPWVYAQKVVTHNHYSFYNPTHHPFFDREGGKIIYFEGTYSATFSKAKAPTPRYDYNQIMYRLDLESVPLPVPVYKVRGPEGRWRLLCREELLRNHAEGAVKEVCFFAFERKRPVEGLVPVYQTWSPDGTIRLLRTPPRETPAIPPFYVVDPKKAETSSPHRRYLLSSGALCKSDPSGEALGLVWRNPLSVATWDFSLTPAPVGNR